VASQVRFSRRALLASALATLATPRIVRGAAPEASAKISDAAWNDLARQITGGVIRPPDPRFIVLTRPENLRFYDPPDTPDAIDPNAPLAVVRPRDPKEVAAALMWAEHVGLPMVPRSGGHSYAACSTIPGLVIHAGAMRQVRASAGSPMIETGGGVLNGDVFSALKNTNHGIVHGRCTTVGLSAFLMGGGIGLSMREFGVGCDRVEAVELVLANGRTVVATAGNDYKDLFWAVRGGGGGNLAFATRWWLRSFPVGKVIAFYAHWWSGDTKAILRRLVRALEASPEQMGAQMSISASVADTKSPNEIKLIGQFNGSRAKFDAALGGALTDADKYLPVELPYWDAQEFFDIEAVPNRYRETSLFADRVSDECIDEACRLMRTLPSPQARSRLTMFLTGGQINKVKPEATAFVHRSSQWLLNPILEWDQQQTPEAHMKWQRDVQDGLAAIIGQTSSYQNFPDPDAANPAEIYWGSNLTRLERVKATYDGHRIFTPPRNQGIPLSS